MIMNEKYDSTQDTYKHIDRVKELIDEFRVDLKYSGVLHDRSKLTGIERDIFNKITPRLKTLTYGSDEYNASLVEMGPALDHHYLFNSHHPEHYKNGIDGMNFIDIVEMLCDWKAATERHDNGNIMKSIEINTKRFNLNPQLVNIMKNTIEQMGWE